MIFREKKSGLTITFLISLLLHLLILYFIPLTQNEEITQEREENLVYLENIQKKELKKEMITKGKIVDLLDEKNTLFKKPIESEYLSDKDRSVDKETKAIISTNKIPNLSENIAESMKDEENKNDNNKLSQNNKEFLPSESGTLPKEKKEMGGERRLKLHPELSLPYDPNYFFEEEGPLTRLNTATSLYASYFTRIKRQISTHWEPIPAFNKIFALNSMNLPENIVTSIEVILDSEGRLVTAFVKKSSGFESWDNESVRSIKAASPFLNPPDALKDEDGKIIFDFSFIGEIGGGGFNRIIR